MPDNVDIDAALIRLRASVREVNESIAALEKSKIYVDLMLSQGANRVVRMAVKFETASLSGGL